VVYWLVIPPIQYDTATATVIATATSMTVAITGLTAFLLRIFLTFQSSPYGLAILPFFFNK
jgi:hypothetical protein